MAATPSFSGVQAESDAEMFDVSVCLSPALLWTTCDACKPALVRVRPLLYISVHSPLLSALLPCRYSTGMR